MPKDVHRFRASNILTEDTFRKLTYPLRDIFVKPFVEAPISPVPNQVYVTGGAKKKRHSRRRGDGSFESLWTSLPIKRILVIGFPSPVQRGIYDVTVFVHDTLRHYRRPGFSQQKGFFLRLSEHDARDDVTLQKRIAGCFDGLEWDDFKDDFEPDELFDE